jgi:hypothetical protein
VRPRLEYVSTRCLKYSKASCGGGGDGRAARGSASPPGRAARGGGGAQRGAAGRGAAHLQLVDRDVVLLLEHGRGAGLGLHRGEPLEEVGRRPPRLGEHLQVLGELAPLDERSRLAILQGLPREVGLDDLVELGGGHRELDPLVAERVAQRAAEGGEVEEALLHAVEAAHQVAHVEAAHADEFGHAVPDGLTLAQALRVEDPHVARKRRVDAHGRACERVLFRRTAPFGQLLSTFLATPA